MKIKNVKKYLVIILISMILFIINPTFSQAALQANKGGKSLSTNANNFFKGMREMETYGGTLGKSANLDTTTYLDSSKNGIDVHMILNTEWGTAAMLAASKYGSAPRGRSDASTTGNETGIYQMANTPCEFVAGIKDYSNDYISTIKSADPRYYNLYTTSFQIYGDGMDECMHWLDAGAAWYADKSKPIYVRGFAGIFDYRPDPGYGQNLGRVCSRAAVVCGAGL